MRKDLQKVGKSYNKKLRRTAFTKSQKQKLKLVKKKICWILDNLNWDYREIARPLSISHHTAKRYITEVKNDPHLKEIACIRKLKRVTRKRKDMSLVEFDIQSNQSFAKRTIGTRHNYDKQNDY